MSAHPSASRGRARVPVLRRAQNAAEMRVAASPEPSRVQALLDAYHLTEEIGPANIYGTRRDVIAAFGRRAAPATVPGSAAGSTGDLTAAAGPDRG